MEKGDKPMEKGDKHHKKDSGKYRTGKSYLEKTYKRYSY